MNTNKKQIFFIVILTTIMVSYFIVSNLFDINKGEIENDSLFDKEFAKSNNEEKYYYDLINYIYKQVNCENIEIGQPPIENCHFFDDPTQKCKDVFSEIKNYLYQNSDSIRIVFFSGDANGKIDLNKPNTIFLNRKFIKQGEFKPYIDQEEMRTVIHEIYHLRQIWSGENPSHSNHHIKDCEYYSHNAFMAEFCLTGLATFIEVNYSDCVLNDSIIIILNNNPK